MSTIVTCKCGQRCKVPSNADATKIACPKCGRRFASNEVPVPPSDGLGDWLVDEADAENIKAAERLKAVQEAKRIAVASAERSQQISKTIPTPTAAEAGKRRSRYPNLRKQCEWGRVIAGIYFLLMIAVAVLVELAAIFGIYALVVESAVASKAEFQTLLGRTIAEFVSSAVLVLLAFVGRVVMLASIELVEVIIDIEANTRRNQSNDEESA